MKRLFGFERIHGVTVGGELGPGGRGTCDGPAISTVGSGAPLGPWGKGRVLPEVRRRDPLRPRPYR